MCMWEACTELECRKWCRKRRHTEDMSFRTIPVAFDHSMDTGLEKESAF